MFIFTVTVGIMVRAEPRNNNTDLSLRKLMIRQGCSALR